MRAGLFITQSFPKWGGDAPSQPGTPIKNPADCPSGGVWEKAISKRLSITVPCAPRKRAQTGYQPPRPVVRRFGIPVDVEIRSHALVFQPHKINKARILALGFGKRKGFAASLLPSPSGKDGPRAIGRECAESGAKTEAGGRGCIVFGEIPKPRREGRLCFRCRPHRNKNRSARR